MARGSNLSRLGDFNQIVLLDAIRRAGAGISRVELVAETGLTAQTVSNIVRRLLAADLIVEGGRVQSAVRGKPRTLLKVRPDARFAVGVHVDPAILTYVLIDLDGQVRQYARRRTRAAGHPEQVVAAIADEVRALLAVGRSRGVSVLGIGVAAPGPLDVVQGVLLKPPQLAGWERVRLRADLREATGLHVLVDKDVTAAATGERWAHGGARHNFLFCYLGSGVGAGIVMDDAVLRGASNNIGEIGNIRVWSDADDVGIGLPGSLAVDLPAAGHRRTGGSPGPRRRRRLTVRLRRRRRGVHRHLRASLRRRRGLPGPARRSRRGPRRRSGGVGELPSTSIGSCSAARSGPGSAAGCWPCCPA